MYPDWPETAADLVPQPLCPGPKLAAFDFQGPQDIEFLEYLGEGLHSHVIKVKIKGQEYALKLFRFAYDGDWTGPGEYTLVSSLNSTRAKLTVVAQYSEPFNAECRAFGRLQEAGHPELAISCYGYILLDEENERRLQEKFNLEFNGEPEISEHDLRGRFLGERSGKPPPIRGILKELGSTYERSDAINFTVPTLRRLLRDTMQLQQLGIISHDIRLQNLVNNKVGDFSTAVTVPHFVTTPELNPHLTEAQRAKMEVETFWRARGDYWNFIQMMLHMEDNPGQRCKLSENLPVLPGYCLPRRAKRFVLRQTPRRKRENQRVFTKVDPRRYNWKAAAAAAADETQGRKKRRPKKTKTTLPTHPDLWYLDCAPEKAAEIGLDSPDHDITVSWRVDDAGFVFPEDTGYPRRIYLEEELLREDLQDYERYQVLKHLGRWVE